MQYLRCGQASLLHQLGYVNEGLAVFVLGRRIHDDAAGLAVGTLDAEITAKAGICTGNSKRFWKQVLLWCNGAEPLVKQGFAFGASPGGSDKVWHGKVHCSKTTGIVARIVHLAGKIATLSATVFFFCLVAV